MLRTPKVSARIDAVRQAYIEGWRRAFDPKNKAEVVAIPVERLKLPEDAAVAFSESTKNEFNRDGAIDMAGVDNVLKLRAEYEGGRPASADNYLDLSYYRKALAGL